MEIITRSERERMYILTRSKHLRMEIITLVEESSFLHAHYLDLFNIDQFDINLIIVYEQHAHSPFSFVLVHANLPF